MGFCRTQFLGLFWQWSTLGIPWLLYLLLFQLCVSQSLVASLHEFGETLTMFNRWGKLSSCIRLCS